MTNYAPLHLEIAACLWEAVLALRDRPAADPDALERALAANDSGRSAYLEFTCSQFPVYGAWAL